MVSRDWCRASTRSVLSMRTTPGTPSSLGVCPRKRDWECNPRNVFPGTESGMLFQEQHRGASRSREQPLVPPPRGWRRTGTRRGGIMSPPHPRATSTPPGTVSRSCVLRPCPHRAGLAPLHWGQDRGHIWLHVLDMGVARDTGTSVTLGTELIQGHRRMGDTGQGEYKGYGRMGDT